MAEIKKLQIFLFINFETNSNQIKKLIIAFHILLIQKIIE